MSSTNISEETKLLTSYAVFRELFDVKSDVYGVISLFIDDVIRNNSLRSFNYFELTTLVNSTYEFDIPPSVIKTALGRLPYLEKEETNYLVTDFSLVGSIGGNIEKKSTTIISNNNEIIESLYQFIEINKGVLLNEFDKKKIAHSFCGFLLDQQNGGDYLEYILSFIVENQDKKDFKDQLNLIREGVILYSGIKFNVNLNEVSSWRTELTIFVETEILFHIAGYNGELYKKFAADLLGYIREINQSAGKRLIRLKYFKETKTEIEGFFTKARYLVENREAPNLNSTAMVSIINGSSKPSDIITRRADFFTLLTGLGIEEDDYKNYSLVGNERYNVISQEIMDELSTNSSEEDANAHINALNYVSIRRGERSNDSFENIGYILLTANTKILNLAWNKLIKDDGQVPLATFLGFLINRFWFKLNKGFGKNTLPTSFDVIAKAQMSLSKVLNDTVSEQYSSVLDDYKNGVVDSEIVTARLVDLRDKVRKPEEIENDNVKDILSIINEDRIEKFIAEQNHFKEKARKQEEEVRKQEEKNGQLEADLTKKEKENKELDTNLKNEKQDQFRKLNAQRIILDLKINRYILIYKIISIIVILSYYCILCYLIKKIGWGSMEPYTYILGILPIILSMLYLIFMEKSINLINFINSRKKKIETRIYTKYVFDLEKYLILKEEFQKNKQ